MKHLAALNNYFIRYKWRLVSGLIFVTLSNLFAVVSPIIVRDVLDEVQSGLSSYQLLSDTALAYDMKSLVFHAVFNAGIILLALALVRGVFMFFMRQTLIVMSRHIEYDQKKEIYRHYQNLDVHFFKTHFTGDLMNRISEDVSRVRMYTGPCIMYATNLTVLTIMCVWGMMRVNGMLTLFVVLPLPLLAFTIYYVNSIIHRKTEKIQTQLSELTTTAQESYSGIRVIRSFVQEKNILGFFNRTSEAYRKSAINLSLTEAIYFPTMTFFVGLSMLLTIFAGGYLAINGKVSVGHIAEFIIYINMLMFPISSIGWVASMAQRAAVSQKRINEFLHTESKISEPESPKELSLHGNVEFKNVRFTYQHTGITALKDFSLKINAGEKIAVIGKTGSGKSTLAHLLLRMYDATNGSVLIEGKDIKEYSLHSLRTQIGYVPQEAYLFSDTVYRNITFGRDSATEQDVRNAAHLADLDKDIQHLQNGYETLVGERGVMLSGGQKQRIGSARALIKNSKLIILDESLSAVDTQTEKTILANLDDYLKQKTIIVITHRLFMGWDFDKIVVMEDGRITEQGTHEELMQRGGYYSKLYLRQTATAGG